MDRTTDRRTDRERIFPAECTVRGTVLTGTYGLDLQQSGPPEAPEPPGTWEPPDWLIRDRELHDVPDTPRPGYLATYDDPVFHSHVTRVSGDPGEPIPNGGGATWGELCRHHLVTSQAWNCDQSLIMLSNGGAGASGPGGLLLDGESYEVEFMRHADWPPGADVRWHPTEPDVIDFARLSTWGTFNVRTGATTFLKDFGSEYTDVRIGQNRGNRSFDGKMVALSARKTSRPVIIPYDIENDVQLPDIWPDEIGEPRSFSACMMAPAGRNIVINYSGDHYDFIDLEGNLVNALTPVAAAFGDCAFDANGDEVWSGRLNSSSIGLGSSGTISKWRLRDGQRTQLTIGGYVYNTGTRAQNINATGHAQWCCGDTRDNGSGGIVVAPYSCELLLMALSGSTVYRLCHHHSSNPVDNDAQPQPSMSPDASRVIFASAWRATGAAPRPVGAYVVDYRE
jgi:hypothetical protein